MLFQDIKVLHDLESCFGHVQGFPSGIPVNAFEWLGYHVAHL